MSASSRERSALVDELGRADPDADPTELVLRRRYASGAADYWRVVGDRVVSAYVDPDGTPADFRTPPVSRMLEVTDVSWWDDESVFERVRFEELSDLLQAALAMGAQSGGEENAR